MKSRSTLPRQRQTTPVIAVLLTLLAGVAVATAGPRCFNSGADDNGLMQPAGTVDAHISIVDRTDGLTDTSAYVVSAYGFWLENTYTSAWVCAAPYPGSALNAQWTFRVPVDFTGVSPANLALRGRVSSDNGILWTKLNGAEIGFTNGANNFNQWSELVVTNGLTAGMNYLDFCLDDFGVVSGFRIEFDASVTPAPQRASLELSPAGDLLITGTAGATYQIETVDAIGSTNWQPLTEVQINQSPEIYTDPDFYYTSQRFYRAVLLP